MAVISLTCCETHFTVSESLCTSLKSLKVSFYHSLHHRVLWVTAFLLAFIYSLPTPLLAPFLPQTGPPIPCLPAHHLHLLAHLHVAPL